MPSATFERLQELRSKNETDLTDEEDLELDQLYQQRRKERALAIPRLMCCEAAKRYPAVSFYLSDPEGTGNAKPVWRAHLDRTFSHALDSGDPRYYRGIPEAKFCPYCGTPPPTVRLRTDLANRNPIARLDHSRCLNCGEQSRGCVCDPAEAAYEPDL
jgi:hypothetical protein